MKLKYNNIHYKLLFLLFAAIFTSCSDDFLEVIPKGRLIAEKVVDYDKMFYNLNLVNMRSTNAQVPLGPEFIAFEPQFSSADLRTQRLYKWEALVYEAEQNSGELENTMENLYIYNKIINEVLQATDGLEQDKLALQAEAKVGRAWVYLLLINYYGLPYNSETSATDLGFPLITEADLVASNFTRATVKEVYDFIIEDLTSAIPYLPTSVISRFRLTKATGNALLGKTYMFMGEFDKAEPYLEDAYNQMSNMGIEARLIDHNQGYSGQRVDTDPESLYGKQIVNNWANTSSEFAVKPEVMALYNENDLRLNLYSPNIRGGGAYSVEGANRKVTGSGQTACGVRIQEIYLFNAEVKCRLNDLEGAVEVLEEFRRHRMPAEFAVVPTDITSDKEALLRFIFDERLREFAGLGFYWFDVRRLTVDVDIPTPVSNFTHTVYDSQGNVVSSHTLTKERLVLRFPQTVLDQNPNLTDND
ncbi:RagB/SusD family nutrient uptake outer membrane protein [Aestuariibaculum sp. YM273]|uniref:RagB/SusD family nutrient uptake outer membrane protein n=1 Tax=Aestuariibaculum sp. YM273 TaxID=3070659 RepID=UPI0027DB24E0|nr:RagB/SusD family nutrient uptake outer membrane protein [Aestuariibaculum sp. YM273]WMI64136.1 RagB/SusD family nutrient uptake outer membrane protein [Aestuariibaculum sp. YM273]